MDMNMWIVIGTNLIIGGAIYGGIRADLKHMGVSIAKLEVQVDRENAELKRSSDKCHERLDSHIEHHHMGINGHRRS